MNPGHADNPWTPTAARLREALAEAERLRAEARDAARVEGLLRDEIEQLRVAWATFNRDPTIANADAITALFAR